MNVIVAGGGTGGHLYPGLAIARALVRLRPDIVPHFVGAERGIERDVLPATEFSYTLLDLHPLHRRRLWQNWRTLQSARTAWRAMGQLARALKPSVMIGTGGYASGVPLIWGWRYGIPLVQHIGDSHPGVTARYLTRVSREVYLGFPEAARWLAHGRAVLCDTGNPIEPPPDIRADGAAARAHWGFPPHARVLLVFGGSQGARAINQVVAQWIARGIPDTLCMIWATGRAQYDAFKQLDRADVRVVPYLSPIADAYAAAELALVRGGTTGTSELCAWGVPMLICPLPTAAQDHQTSNAVALERAGAALHVPQAALTVDRLDRDVRALLTDAHRLGALARGARERARPNAAREIAQRIVGGLDRAWQPVETRGGAGAIFPP